MKLTREQRQPGNWLGPLFESRKRERGKKELELENSTKGSLKPRRLSRVGGTNNFHLNIPSFTGYPNKQVTFIASVLKSFCRFFRSDCRAHVKHEFSVASVGGNHDPYLNHSSHHPTSPLVNRRTPRFSYIVNRCMQSRRFIEGEESDGAALPLLRRTNNAGLRDKLNSWFYNNSCSNGFFPLSLASVSQRDVSSGDFD